MKKYLLILLIFSCVKCKPTYTTMYHIGDAVDTAGMVYLKSGYDGSDGGLLGGNNGSYECFPHYGGNSSPSPCCQDDFPKGFGQLMYPFIDTSQTWTIHYDVYYTWYDTSNYCGGVKLIKDSIK